VVERAVYRSDSLKISDIIFDPFSSPYETQAQESKPDITDTGQGLSDGIDLMAKPMKEAIWDLKVQMLEKALALSKFNQKKAARLLGLSYHQFRGLYRQYKAIDE
jgi:psp operon transcriptional activator